jgi:hypothetical protein
MGYKPKWVTDPLPEGPSSDFFFAAKGYVLPKPEQAKKRGPDENPAPFLKSNIL